MRLFLCLSAISLVRYCQKSLPKSDGFRKNMKKKGGGGGYGHIGDSNLWHTMVIFYKFLKFLLKSYWRADRRWKSICLYWFYFSFSVKVKAGIMLNKLSKCFRLLHVSVHSLFLVFVELSSSQKRWSKLLVSQIQTLFFLTMLKLFPYWAG